MKKQKRIHMGLCKEFSSLVQISALKDSFINILLENFSQSRFCNLNFRNKILYFSCYSKSCSFLSKIPLKNFLIKNKMTRWVRNNRYVSIPENAYQHLIWCGKCLWAKILACYFYIWICSTYLVLSKYREIPAYLSSLYIFICTIFSYIFKARCLF